MLTKSLSRTDYNKEKKVIVPKVLQRISSQVPVRSHLIQSIDSLSGSIRKLVESERRKDSYDISHLSIEPSLNDFQIKVQDLYRILASREDKITELNNEKQHNDKRIENLEKDKFDLKNHVQKIQYHYKSTIEFLKTQNLTQKTQYLERIAFLEEESRRFQQSFKNVLKSARQVYELRLNTIGDCKESFKQASQDIIKGLKKDINFHQESIDKLKVQMFQNGKKSHNKVSQYQEEIYILREKLDMKQWEFSFYLLSNRDEMEKKDIIIKDLNRQIQQMLKSIDRERQSFLQERGCIEKTKNEKEATLKQKFQQLIQEKKIIENQLHQMRLQFNQIKYENDLLDHKCIDFITKLEASQLQKKNLSLKMQQQVQRLKINHKTKLDYQIQALTKSYERKIKIMEQNLENKNQQIVKLDQKIHILNEEVSNKILQINVLKVNQEKKLKQLQQKDIQTESLKSQLKKVNLQIDIVRASQSTQNKHVQELKSVIKQQSQFSIVSGQKIKTLELQNFRFKSENIQKQTEILKLEKQIKKRQFQFEQMKQKAIKKYSEFKQKSEEVHNNLQTQNNQNLIKLKKTQVQIQSLQQRLISLSTENRYLENQNKLITAQNAQMKRILEKNQQDSSEIITKLKTQQNQIKENLFQDVKNQNQQLQQTNEKLMKNMVLLKLQNLQLMQNNKKIDERLFMLQKELQEKDEQCQNHLSKLEMKNRQIQSFENRVNQYSDFMITLEKSQLSNVQQNKKLKEDLQEFKKFSDELRRLKFVGLKQALSCLNQNHTLKLQLQDQKIQIQCQIKLKKDLQTQLKQAKIEYGQLKNKYETVITNGPLVQNKETFQSKLKEMNQEFQRKNRKLLQKISLLEKEINNKNQQLKQTNKKVKMVEQNLDDSCLKHSFCQRQHQNLINQIQILETQLKLSQEKVEEAQKLIITLKKLIHQYQTKQKLRQIQEQKRNSPQKKQLQTQKNDNQSPQDFKIYFKKKGSKDQVDKAHKIRKDILKVLNQKQRQTFAKIEERRGYFIIPTTDVCLDEIGQLFNEIRIFKNYKNKLLAFLQRYISENQSKAKKFSRIMSEFNQCQRDFTEYEEQIHYQILKWKTVTDENFKTNQKNAEEKSQMKEKEKNSDQKNDSEVSNMVQAPFLPKSIPQEEPFIKIHDMIESVMSLEDETVKKQKPNSFKQTAQTEQKDIKRKNRYEDSQQKTQNNKKN